MDELERRLRRDAQDIDAEVSPELTSRIRAAVRSDAAAMSRTPWAARSEDDVRIARTAGTCESGSGRAERRRTRERAAPPLGLWVAASLSGIAAALVVVLLLPRLVPEEPPRAPQQAAPLAALPPDIAREFPLVVKTAELTAPLEEELDDLKSDLDKARTRVERDLDF